MSGPQIRLCLYTSRPIASKQFKSLLTINTLSWLGGTVETHPLSVQEVVAQYTAPTSVLCLIFYFVVFVFYFSSINSLFVTKFANPFAMLINLVYFTFLQDLWLIIWV